MHRSFRRLAALLTLAIPALLIGGASATWGAAPEAHVRPREPHGFATSPLASDRADVERAESAVVLVVLDGVRWQEVFRGADRELVGGHASYPLASASARALMPNLHHSLATDAIALGAPNHGAEISASGPQFISMPGYLEIFAGHPDPVCAWNGCARPPVHTFVDDVRASSGPSDVAVIASWPNIARASSSDYAGFVVTAGRNLLEYEDVLRSDPKMDSLLDAGAHVPAFPGEGEYRPDAYTAPIALRYLETVRPRFLFVGLGDADEYGHRGDYRHYLEALHASDQFFGDLVATLGRMGARGRHTTVLVTSDHGRANSFRDHGPRHPESGRVWLVAEGGDVHGHGLVSAAQRHTLSDLAPTVRALLGIEGGEGRPIAEIVGEPRAASRP